MRFSVSVSVVRRHQKERRGRKRQMCWRKKRQNTGKDFVGIWYKNVSHQFCLLDSFHCSRPDSRNAVRARTLCARLAGTPRPLQSACGRRGRGTATKPGPEAPSPGRPAGMAPRNALQAECRWRKCHWSCCNICPETEKDGKKSGTHVYKKVQVHCWVLTHWPLSFFWVHTLLWFFRQSQRTLSLIPQTVYNTMTALHTTGAANMFSTVQLEIKRSSTTASKYLGQTQRAAPSQLPRVSLNSASPYRHVIGLWPHPLFSQQPEVNKHRAH